MSSGYEKLVGNVISTTLSVQPNDNVIVETWGHMLPLATEFIYRLREVGARTMLLLEHEKTFWRCADGLPEDKLGKVGDHEWAAVEKANHYIFIPGPADFARIFKNRPKYNAAIGYNNEWYERAEKYRLKAARIALAYASGQRARAYRLSLSGWHRMMLAASSINFTMLREKIATILPVLKGRGDVKITAPNGTDLSLRLASRVPFVADCIVDSDDLDNGRNVANIPGGNTVITTDESFADGVVVFDRPSPYMGKWISGIRWEFKNGQLVNYEAKTNRDLFKSAYEKAEGDKNRVAGFGIGVNPEVRTGFLQDTLAAGAVMVAIGGNDELGGQNKTGFSFQGVLKKATVSVGGEKIVQNGKLTV